MRQTLVTLWMVALVGGGCCSGMSKDVGQQDGHATDVFLIDLIGGTETDECYFWADSAVISRQPVIDISSTPLPVNYDSAIDAMVRSLDMGQPYTVTDCGLRRIARGGAGDCPGEGWKWHKGVFYWDITVAVFCRNGVGAKQQVSYRRGVLMDGSVVGVIRYRKGGVAVRDGCLVRPAADPVSVVLPTKMTR